jgi:hypothetical protein
MDCGDCLGNYTPVHFAGNYLEGSKERESITLGGSPLALVSYLLGLGTDVYRMKAGRELYQEQGDGMQQGTESSKMQLQLRSMRQKRHLL